MHLTRQTDYALRVLIHLAASGDRQSSIAEIAAAYRISRNHLMKVVHQLGLAGFITTSRGRGGGFHLARPATEISVGAVVRATENDLRLADCDTCLIAPACGLTGVFAEAMRAFLTVLDGYSIADITRKRDVLQALFASVGTGGDAGGADG